MKRRHMHDHSPTPTTTSQRQPTLLLSPSTPCSYNTMSTPTVKELLVKPVAEISSFLGGIYEHSAWVSEQLVQNLDSYASCETVTEIAALLKQIVNDASAVKKMALLCAHPDLCEKVGKLESLTQESQEEQSRSGLQSLTEEEMVSFNEFNEAYRTKFGFPFILAVRNATKFTVLAALEGRLPNPVEKEFVISLEQVHKIAWMRLLSKLSVADAKGFLTCHVLDTANGCPGMCVYPSSCFLWFGCVLLSVTIRHSTTRFLPFSLNFAQLPRCESSFTDCLLPNRQDWLENTF